MGIGKQGAKQKNVHTEPDEEKKPDSPNRSIFMIEDEDEQPTLTPEKRIEQIIRSTCFLSYEYSGT